MALTIATILAGLGLFLVGKNLLTSNLRNMVGRSVQLTIARVAASPVLGLFWGAVLGAIIQSTAVVTFILIGLLMARMIEPKRALPIVLGGNIGSSLILLLVTLDIRLVVMLVLGLTGILMTVGRLQHLKTALNAIFGLCLLYYGLVLLKSGTVPLAHSAFFTDMMAGLDGSLAAAFTIGAALSAACQSSITVALLGIGFLSHGFVSFEQALLVIYGTNLGSSAVTYMLSSGVKGTARQVAIYQVGFNLIGCLLMLTLFVVEHYLETPLVMALLQTLSDDIDRQLALSYLAFNSITALFLLPLIGVAGRLLAQRYPTSPLEADSQLAYLGEHVTRDPATAALLAEQEQLRLLLRLPRYVDLLRLEKGPGRTQNLARLHQAYVSVLDQAQPYLGQIADGSLTAQNHDRIYRLIDRQDRLAAVEVTLRDFVAAAPMLDQSQSLALIHVALVEGLDALLLSYVEAMESRDAEDMAMIERITGDRGDVMEGVRRSFLGDGTVALSREEKLGLMQLTGLFERLVFLLRELALKAPFEPAEKEV
ncbi:MAG: Na/Pi symporter [Alphaproteobacteria bacterium]|nr:Na/Pi symporter [Alphaproteobacteria bacterium]MBU0798021.1 Na/Pi symporter [Alphaproteobacteria bacterium]MBU0887561.1 Na/Pi symporter [Alphaproteobacteria bacterium]MBU1814212.1 Na/Pi symporter [Alphaproteobacteria bacterium]